MSRVAHRHRSIEELPLMMKEIINLSEEEFQRDLALALEESAKAHSRQRPPKRIVFLDETDSEDEGNEKVPSMASGFVRGRPTDDSATEDEGDRKTPAEINGFVAVTNTSFHDLPSAASGPIDDYALLKEAIRRSLEESYDDDDDTILHSTCRKLSRQELHEAVDEFVHQQGGYERLEMGQMIKHGNSNDMKKSCIADGGGQHQTAAQYGRYSILGMWRVFDVLEGKADIIIDNYSKGKSKLRVRRDTAGGGSDDNRLIGLPGAKITAFVDVGHGIGIQVLQAGWSLGVPARGVEIMKDRHLVAVAIKDGVIDSLRSDPPDSTAVELRLADFSRAVASIRKNKLQDEDLHSYLLFNDKSKETQEGLVIFANNAEDVFAARSNQNAKGISLDAHLANMFAQMQIGGRMVTLTDISCHLTQSTEWFRHDVFDSGSDAVSWGCGNKSVDLHILTKLSNTWYCQNGKCSYMKYTATTSSCQDSSAIAAPNDVVNEFGELNEICVYCLESARRCTRFRNETRKRKML